jgi:hypothetical protein
MALPSPSSIDDFNRFAESVVDRARTLSLPHFRSSISVHIKAESMG